MKEINVGLCQDVLGNNTKLNTEDWSKRAEDEQNTLHARLAMIRDSLRTAAGLDGPTDPKHIMSGEYATTGAILWWACIGFIVTILRLFIVIWRWGKATGTDFAQRVQAASVAVRDHDAAKDKETKAMAHTCATPCPVITVKHDGLLATAGFPPFGANGLALSKDESNLFIANTGDDRILRLNLKTGELSIWAESIDGVDGLASYKGVIVAAANQADVVFILNENGRVIAKLGDFLGIRDD